MALEPIGNMARHARGDGYAIGYFESWNLESMFGVIDAAEQTRSPIIIGFNGEFLSSPDRVMPEPLKVYAQMGRAMAECASVPCAFIFNECSRDQWIERAAASGGFNVVMPADSDVPYKDYCRRVKGLVQYAHRRGVAVEAELGVLPCGVAGHGHAAASHTDPQQAAAFTKETGVDLLAVSIGNVHVLTDGRRALDIDHLRAIRQCVDTPLVLHGGTGIADDSLRQAIATGVVKVNYGTYIKQHVLHVMRERYGALDPNVQTDPHQLLGIGGPEDLMTATRIAVRDAVLERIETLGCCGKADV